MSDHDIGECAFLICEEIYAKNFEEFCLLKHIQDMLLPCIHDLPS